MLTIAFVSVLQLDMEACFEKGECKEAYFTACTTAHTRTQCTNLYQTQTLQRSLKLHASWQTHGMPAAVEFDTSSPSRFLHCLQVVVFSQVVVVPFHLCPASEKNQKQFPTELKAVGQRL